MNVADNLRGVKEKGHYPFAESGYHHCRDSAIENHMSTTKNDTKTRGQAQQRPPAATRPGSGNPTSPGNKQPGGEGVRFRHPRKVSPHHDETVATAMARNAMSRERYEFHLRALYVVLGLLFLSMAANIYLGIRQPEYVYYALSSDGNLTPVIPLDNPIQSKEQVLSWTSEAVATAFSLSFANYQQQLNDTRYLFTESGWTGFREALTRSRMLETIIQQKLVSTAVPEAAPVIVSSGTVADGRYAWRLEIPLLVSLDSASAVSQQRFLLEVVVQRVSETENPRGLAIGQIIAR